MGKSKNTVKRGKGRPPGAANKATLQAREAIATFVEGNVWRLNGLLDDIAKESPLAAFNCLTALIEFHVPKMARIEHTGADGKDLYSNMTDEQMLARLQALLSATRPITIDAKPLTLNQQLIEREHDNAELNKSERSEVEIESL